MTTIAISADGNSIAADGLVTNGWGGIASRSCRKIAQKNGRVYAVAGTMSMIGPLVEWHQDGCNQNSRPFLGGEYKWSLLVWERDGGWFLYTSDAPYPDPIELPYAIGTGGEYALGAMYAGASPREAVEIACRLDTRSGGEIQVVNIAEALGVHRLEAAE